MATGCPESLKMRLMSLIFYQVTFLRRRLKMGVVVKEKEKGSGEWWIFIFYNGLKKTKKIGKDKKMALEVAKGIEERLVSVGKIKQPVPYRSVEKRKREGLIYIMSNSGHNYLKIGCSQH